MGTPANVIAGGPTSVTIDGTDIGYTYDGVTMEKTPEYFEKEVDQVLDAVGLVPTNYTMMVSLNLTEAQLTNLKIAWNELTAPATNVLNLGIDPNVQEHDLIVKGPAPGTTNTQRQVEFFRCVSFEASENSIKKDDRVMYPISFRVLPVVTNASGSEYGIVSDT